VGRLAWDWKRGWGAQVGTGWGTDYRAQAQAWGSIGTGTQELVV
jgi:hypothetical protein